MSTTPIGDHDRDRVVRLLQEQVGAGRLTLTEFDRRASRAYTTDTRTELDSLLADLPAEPPPPATPRTSQPIIPAALGLLAVALFVAGLAGTPALLVAAGLCAAMAYCHRPAATAAGSPSSSGGSVRGCCAPGDSASSRLAIRSGRP